MTDHQCEACALIHQAEDHTHQAEDPETAENAVVAGTRHIRNENRLMKEFRSGEDEVADAITAFAGSMNFIYLHSVWFGIWVVVNIGLIGSGLEFDKFPFGLLTMIVSLEAIFLSTFVMLSQNRQSQRADLRAELDFETNVRSEIWSIHIGQKLGVETEHIEGAVQVALQVARRQQLADAKPV